MAGGRDAGAYALQVTETQNDIIANINKKHADDQALVSAYKQVALAPYIRAMLNEESPLTYGEAEKARVQVAEWAPDYRDAQADIHRVKFEQPIQAGHGAVYVFSMVGRGPVKIQEHAIATQAALLVADRIVSANSSQGLPPTLAPVLVPKVVTSVPLVDAVRVSVGQETLGDTATMVQIGGMAQSQFDANFPYILGENNRPTGGEKGGHLRIEGRTGHPRGITPQPGDERCRDCLGSNRNGRHPVLVASAR